METLWFCLLALLLAGYVLLDGYDLGVGALHLALARSERERRQSLAAIAPFWDANEVWLITAGGTLFFSFPRLYASSFSGFYLPLMIVLWLLIVRGISIEFRNHLTSPTWAPAWDAGFAFSSALLIVFFGVALGNLLRGVPLDASGEFFIPLWTDFRLGGSIGILDWYTSLTGFFALCARSVCTGLSG
jgi:cytochrome d oxidase, subunit II (cydB)